MSGTFLALVEAPRGLAIGIAGAGHELPEAPALQHHHPPAVLAVLLLRGLLHVGGIQVRQVNRIFLGERAGVGIVLVVGAAGEEGAVLAPLDHQRRAAAFAHLVGGLLHPLDVFHVLLGVAEVLLELLVEIAERVGPLFLAFFDLVQLFFQPGRVLEIENVLEVLHQQVGHHQPDLGRHEFSAQLLHVLALLDGADNRRVRGRPPDAALFQLLHQRRFVVARRRLGEVLLRLQFLQRQRLAGLQHGQLVLERLVLFVLRYPWLPRKPSRNRRISAPTR